MVNEQSKTRKSRIGDDNIEIFVEKTHARFVKAPVSKAKPFLGTGEFYLLVNVTALNQTIYLPVSIATGRQSTGFIYVIEGGEKGEPRARIDARGEGTTNVTSGSIVYIKIPPGKTATFKILIDITSSLRQSYKVVVSRINYKLNPNDPRYKRLLTEISTNSLTFR